MSNFIFSCSIGQLDKAKKIYSLRPNIDILMGGNYIFHLSCANGHLNVIQWLYSLRPDMYILAENNQAFHLCIINHHQNIIKWLLKICPIIDISPYQEYLSQFGIKFEI